MKQFYQWQTGEWLDYTPGNSGPSSVTVHQPDNNVEYSGLVDQHGQKLVRERQPIGFVRC